MHSFAHVTVSIDFFITSVIFSNLKYNDLLCPWSSSNRTFACSPSGCSAMHLEDQDLAADVETESQLCQFVHQSVVEDVFKGGAKIHRNFEILTSPFIKGFGFGYT